MDLDAFEPHRYLVKTERVRLFVEGINVPDCGRHCMNFSYYSLYKSFYEKFLLSEWQSDGDAGKRRGVRVVKVSRGAGRQDLGNGVKGAVR
jgi:hypothetical protein